MLLLIISATYAYFSVTITGNGSKSMITANTPKKHSLSVSTLYDDIHIHVDNNDMKLLNVGSYYGAVNDNRYEKTKEEGTHQIIEVSSKGMENIRYSCSGDIKVTLNIDSGSMGSVLEKEDVLLYIKGLGLDETLDLSTLKINDTKIYQTTFDIDGDSSDYLSAIVELINKESYQNYIANKILNVKIEAENMICHENGTYKYMIALNKYVKEMQNGKESEKFVSLFYDDEGMYQKIQNIYLVDYIDTSKAIKTWELGDTGRGTKSDEVMGWLEATPNEDDRYDLYIGSEGPMRAPQDMRYAFYQFTNLKKIEGDSLDTSEVTNMIAVFSGCSNLIDISSLSNWNTKNVINTGSMFGGARKLENITPVINFDMASLTNMGGMFYNCNSLIDITPLRNWDVSNVTTMNDLFSGTRIDNLMPLSNWNLENATRISDMLRGTLISDLTPIANWDTSNVTNMSNIFNGTSITDISPIKNWNISKATYIGGMFANCTNLTDIGPLASWDVSKVTDIENILKNTSVSDITPIANWDVSHVLYMGGMFAGCTNLSDISPISDWNVSSVISMSNSGDGINGGMFANCSNISNIMPLVKWDVSKVTNMAGMFYNTTISNISSLSNWNVQNVTDMSGLFSLTKVKDLEPIKDWNTQKVTNMRSMFENTQINDLTPLEHWDVSNVITMGVDGYRSGGMFSNCINLTDLSPIGNWDVSNVTSMANMFSGNSKLTKIDLSKWKMPKLTNVTKMFSGCSNLTEIYLPLVPFNNIVNLSNYQNIFGKFDTSYYPVSNNITVYTESSQVDWVKARLQEALSENNNSTVLTY